MLYIPLQFKMYEVEALLDTGAVQSALSLNEIQRISLIDPNAILEELPHLNLKYKLLTVVLFL